MKVVRLSAVRTGHLYPPGNIFDTHFCQRLSWPQGHSAAGRIMLVKNCIDTSGNRNRDLPACSSVPQLLHRVPRVHNPVDLYTLIDAFLTVHNIYIYIYMVWLTSTGFKNTSSVVCWRDQLPADFQVNGDGMTFTNRLCIYCCQLHNCWRRQGHRKRKGRQKRSVVQGHFEARFAKLRKATISLVMSVPPFARMEKLGSHCTDFHEIWYLKIIRKSLEKIQFSLKSDKTKGTLHEDQYTFLITSRSVLLRMRNDLK